MKYTILILILFSLAPHISGDTINCKAELTTLNGTSGTIQIDRKTGCLVQAGHAFLAISSQNLYLDAGEYITVNPGTAKESNFNITGPITADYYVFSTKVELSFQLKNRDGIMLIDYYQGDSKDSQDLLPITLGSRSRNILIQSYWKEKYQIQVSALGTMVHLQIEGSMDPFNHYLVQEKEAQKIIVSGDIVSIKSTATRQDCSTSNTVKDTIAIPIRGPTPDTIKDAYRCVNIFEFSGNSQAHFDVDFSDFMGITDRKDELRLDDGHQILSINFDGALEYATLKRLVSFQGPSLVIIYDSPEKISPKDSVKLNVRPQTVGGVINQYQALDLPSNGLVRYTLRSQNDDGIPALEIKGKLATDLTIYDSQNRILKIGSGDFCPPIIALPRDAIAEFNIKHKTSATVTYKKEKRCSGTVFGSSGTISIGGGKQICVWLIGSNSTIRVDAHNLQHPESCLKIYSLDSGKAVFDRCNLDPTLLLPPIALGPAYINITTASNVSRFEATISNELEDKTLSSAGPQTRYNSAGYPSWYLWTPYSENFSIDSTNKSSVLSIMDVDIREGEKLTINSKEVNSQNYLTFEDFDISNSTANILISRSLATEDFAIHKGYSLMTNTYQNIMSADVSAKSISTQKNQTSLLLRISAPGKARIAYSITNLTSGNQNFVMNVIDSRSVSGRQFPDEEKYNSTTTSNMLLIGLTTVKANTTLPEFKIAFSPVPCNETSDHVCDQSTRCVPAAKLCKGKSYCLDGTDLRVECSSGPAPRPPVVGGGGYGGLTVFVLSILMFSLGVVGAKYGPDAYKNLEARFRSGQYTTFTSTE